MPDLPGQAIYNHYFHKDKSKLWVLDAYGPKVEMPVLTYFRNNENMPLLEQTALSLCNGKILDIGAGAGSHALALQEKGKEVSALEISPLACEVMRHRGVEKVVCADFFQHGGAKYDTLLLLMNGIGLCGSIDGFRLFLQHAHTMLQPDGQILFDSCDVAYMFDGEIPATTEYYGQFASKYQYKGETTPWFNWLYIDRNTLGLVARDEGWHTEILSEDEDDQYLARLTLAQ
ncbi:MAG: methyltransferase domain-containing protein [Edaphocola sp.]